MTAAPGASTLAYVQVTCPGQPGRATYLAVRSADLARIVAGSRDDLVISACDIELPPGVIAAATALLGFAQASEFAVGSAIDGVFVDGPLRGQAAKVGPDPAPVTCPWCKQAMPSDAYSAHLVRLPEAPDGFVCMPPEEDVP